MRIATKLIISMDSLEVIDRVTHEYSGPLALCKGGGGGGAGAVDYPDYMEDVHNDWLDQTGTDNISDSITGVMNTALAANPLTGVTSHDPATALTAAQAAITAFAAILAGITDTTNWAALYTQAKTSLGTRVPVTVLDAAVSDIAVSDVAITDIALGTMVPVTAPDGIDNATIVNEVGNFGTNLDDEITNKVLPRFRRGMQDINAVVSSAFPIGEAIIEAFRDREVAKFETSLRLAAAHKNADIETEAAKWLLETRKANLEVGVKEVEDNFQKEIKLVTGNQLKDLEVAKSNQAKDIEIAKSNLVKEVQIVDIDMRSDVEYVRMYLSSAEQMLKLMLQRLMMEEDYTKIVVEFNRIKIVAEKEEVDVQTELDIMEARWDLEVFQYGSNVLAGISGGVGQTRGPSKVQSAIGGGLSGVAAGAMMGSVIPGVGTAAGATVGGILGVASAFF